MSLNENYIFVICSLSFNVCLWDFFPVFWSSGENGASDT